MFEALIRACFHTKRYLLHILLLRKGVFVKVLRKVITSLQEANIYDQLTRSLSYERC